MPALVEIKNIDKIRLGDTHKIRRVYAGNNLVYGLPTNMQELEYIQSSGTQYIDSGFKPNQNTKTLTNLEIVADNHGVIYGCDDGWKVSGFSVTDRYSEFGTQTGSFTFARNTKYKIELGNQIKVDDTLIKNFDQEIFQSPHNLAIFGLNRQDTVQEMLSLKLYDFQLHDGSTLVRNFIPAKAEVASRNLLNSVLANSQYWNGLTYTKDSSGKITFSGTPTAVWSNITAGFTLPAGNYTLSIQRAISQKIEMNVIPGAVINPGSTKVSFTVAEDVATNIHFYNLQIGTPISGNIELQLEEGSTPTQYEPYYEAGKVGLYDLANNRFYINSGTGDFTAGGEV